MLAPTVTKRKVINQDSSGVDIFISGYHEVKAPLGGTTLEYEVTLVSNLPAFKTRIHNQDDVISYTVSKSFLEIQDFAFKAGAKFHCEAITHNFPTCDSSPEVNKKLLNQVLKELALVSALVTSDLFFSFMGLVSLRAPHASTSQMSDLEDLEKMSKNVSSNNKEVFSNIFEKEKKINSIKSKVEAEDDDEEEDLFQTKSKSQQVKKPFVQSIMKPKLEGDAIFGAQDYGGPIQKEEESLFLLMPKKDKSSNPLLKAKSLDIQSSDQVDEKDLDFILKDPLLLPPIPANKGKPKPKLPPKPTKLISQPTKSVAKPSEINNQLDISSYLAQQNTSTEVSLFD